MLKKKQLPSYSDGIVEIYRERGSKTSFGARVNPRSREDMDHVVTLCYADQGIRERDYSFAEQRGFNLEAKIKTPRCPGVDTDCRAVIGDDIYTISHIDITSREMFFYLEGGDSLGADDTGQDPGSPD